MPQSVAVLYVSPRGVDRRLDGAEFHDDVSVTAVHSTQAALDALADATFDCVVVEDTPTADVGLETLSRIRSERPSLPLVFCSETPDGERASEATRYDIAAYHVHQHEESLAERVRTVLEGSQTGGNDTPKTTHGRSAGAETTSDRLAQSDGAAVVHDTPFQSMAGALNAAVVTIDTDSTIHFANEALAELTGHDHENLVGSSFTMVMPERFREAHHAAIQRYAESRERTLDWDYIELRVKHRDGHEVPVAVSFDEFEHDGELFFTGVLRDISEQKAYTEALSALHETTQRLLQATSAKEVAQITVEATADILGYELNTVRLYDPEREVLWPVAVPEGTTREMGDRPAYDVDTWGQGEAFQRGETVVYEDLSKYDPIGADAGPEPSAYEAVESAMFVPLAGHGVLSVGANDLDAFDETARSLAEVLASNVAGALDRVEREDELRTYETVLESVQNMVYVLDADGRFSLVTDPFVDWVGYDREDVVGADPSLVLDDADIERFQTKIEELRHSNTESVTVETTLLAADGTELPAEVEVSLYPTEGSFAGTIGVVRDRTELREARRELETQRDRFSYLFDTLPDAVVEVVFEDDVPVVTATNDAFEEVFGYETERVVGESINEFLLPEQDRDEGRAIDDRIAEMEEWSGEVRRETADGLRYFLFRGVPYRDADGTQRGFGIYTDITDRKHRERRLQVLSRVLRHNLRNDLTVILGYAELLETEVDRDHLEDAAAALREKATDVAALSERARTVQRVLDVDGPPERTVRLKTYVEHTVEAVDPPAEATVEVDVPALLRVRADERLDVALANLIENALDHAGDHPHVRVTAKADGDDLVIRVADDGPGIPDAEWDIVAGPDEITQLSHGSGLGLWTVKWVTESYGGRMSRRDSDVGGDAVVLCLPGYVTELL